ncbi:ATP-binding protein [Cellulomonas sp. McL0617]|uniref:ATP-binding protein n=1 Tax=Cellulomonas sp. McL0617 TaxID=3415675 RepID=UPI003CFABB7A
MRADLIGRDSELDTLFGAIGSVEVHGQAILLTGDPGVGKSSILRAAAEMAGKDGRLVLRTSGIETESALPYAGLHYLLAPLLGAADTLPPVQQRAILTAFGLADGPAPEVFLIALAALGLITGMAVSCPVVAVIDDMHWLDPPTNDVLAFVARRISQDPVVIIGAVRPGHDIAYSASKPYAIDLRGLDDGQSREVLSHTAMDLSPRDRQMILDQARGNPLALTELPAAWRSASRSTVSSVSAVMPLSGRLERAFAARVTELPAPTRDALLVAAVSSEGTLSEILAAASLLRGTSITTSDLEAAQSADILRFDEAKIEFRHPLVRSGILQHESVGRRQAANAAMGHVLYDQPYRRAWHRAQAVYGPDDAVADELDASHSECIRRGSIVAAISALERSAQLTTSSHTRGRRLLLAAQLAFGLGRADLVDHLVTAAEQNDLSDLDQARVEYLREIFNDGAPGDSRRVLDLTNSARRSAAAGDDDLALDLLLGAALRCWWADTGAAARARVAEVVEGLTLPQDDPRCIASIAIAEPLLKGTQTIQRLSAIRVESITDAEQLRLLGIAARVVGDEPRAADFFDRAEAKLRDQGRLGLLSHVLAVGAAVHVELGDWRKAVESVEQGLQLAEETRQPNWSTGITAVEAMVAGLTGDTEKAHQRADEVERASTSRVINDALCNAQLARGFAYLSSGHHADAYAALKVVFDPTDRHHHSREHLSGVMFLAEAARHCDQVDDARHIIERVEKIAEVTTSPVLATQLLYARAVLADDDTAEAHFVDGLAYDLTRWPWTRARIQLAYGYWLRRQRRVAESREPLSAALVTFDRIGATAWAQEARSELRATGARDAADDPTTAVARLSAQELRIARLAATGLSNREIGQQLYLSPRTVGAHLYRMFPKLGIRTRAQLGARLEAEQV